MPTNFIVQTGNGQVFLSWDQMATAISYVVSRSLDGITYVAQPTITGSPLANYYLDTTATAGTTYYYQVLAENGSGNSPSTTAQSCTPAAVGQVSLGWVRLHAQLRADLLNSQFVSLPEWNMYLTNSYKELYDLLAQKFGDDYFVTTPYSFTTVGGTQLYALPGDCYKLMGVEISANPADTTSWVSIPKFEFADRNKFNGPNIYNFYRLTNIRYRMNGSNLMLVPSAQGGQTVQIWYAPRPQTLMRDFDLLDGISGWEEYVIVDAAIKARVKQESDVTELYTQKMALKQRIEEAAENRDVGEPECVSDVVSRNGWSDYGGSYGRGGL